MLYCQSWQSRAQSLCTLVFVLAGTCVMLASCFQGNRELSEAERSAFSTYVDSLDSSITGKWFTRMGISEDADSMLAYLRRELPRNGLDTAAFQLAEIAEDLSIVHALAFDSVGISINELLPRLDERLTHAYVRYTVGQRYGFVSPEKLFNRLDSNVRRDGFARLFDYEIKARNVHEAEQKVMDEDRLDYLLASQPTGQLYQILQVQLDNTSDKAARRRLAVNMERCRWKISHPEDEDRKIVVNIPSLQLWAVCADSVVNMKICCGALATKTPLLHSQINYLQVNPDWIIPQNIVDTDITRHAGDSAYFARNNYYIVRRSTGDTLQTASVTADQLRTGALRVGQKGGPGNSLGRIVFRFPNNFGVYLHDTNNRGAFNRERRTLSHGCIRVQKPFELACFLLPEADEWKLDRIRISMDIAPETDQGKEYLEEHVEDPRPYRLLGYSDVSPKTPVYIIYYTAYPNPESGQVETWPDLYGYDKVIDKAMGDLLPK